MQILRAGDNNATDAMDELSLNGGNVLLNWMEEENAVINYYT